MAGYSPIKLLSMPYGSHHELYNYGQKHFNCTKDPNYVPWIWTLFGECVTNTVEYTGFILGLIQLLCWILVMFPQFYENYKRGKMDEAIAPAFLILWMFGDLSNLIGCLLTDQLFTQLATAVYYLFMDALIISQFTYYYFKNKKKKVYVVDSLQENPAVQTRNQDHSHIIYCCTFLLSTSLLISLPWQQGQSSSPLRSSGTGRSLLSIDSNTSNTTEPPCIQYYKDSSCIFFDSLDIFGYVCGCLSGVFYVGSRIPQLLQNYRRQSVEGVSILMFILTVTGNVFYGASVLMEDTSMVFLIRHLPWLVGSLGTLFFDCIMLTQFARFRYCRSERLRSAHEDDDRKKLLNGANGANGSL